MIHKDIHGNVHHGGLTLIRHADGGWAVPGGQVAHTEPAAYTILRRMCRYRSDHCRRDQ